MNDIESAYQEVIEIAKTLPPERAIELVACAAMVRASTAACIAVFDAREKELIAAAKPVKVAV